MLEIVIGLATVLFVFIVTAVACLTFFALFAYLVKDAYDE